MYVYPLQPTSTTSSTTATTTTTTTSTTTITTTTITTTAAAITTIICNGLPCNSPEFDFRWERCKNRASRSSQGTVNGVLSLNDLAVDGT